MSDSSSKKWYVVRAVSGQEKKVKDYIEAEIHHAKLSDHVSQVLIPTEKFYQIRNGKKISKERNFFPGYIMLEADLIGEIPHIIKSVTGVIGFLGETKGGDPVPRCVFRKLIGFLARSMNLPYLTRNLVTRSLLVKL
jgi:transcriptional antiterminator NusG